MPMKARCSYISGIRAFESAIRIEFENAEIRDAVDRFLLPTLPRCEVAAESADVRIAVLKDSREFQVFIDEREVASADTVEAAALGAVKALDDALVQKLRTLRAVHAGAVVLQGKALLIPGSSHAGKSSLVAALLRRGAAHLSDEYALVDREGRVHAYPRPLLLRNGSPRQTLVLPSDLNAHFQLKPVEVGWILAVDYDPEGAWNVMPISQAEAVMRLLRNTPHEMERSPEMVELFTRAAAAAECYAGTRGDVVEAVDSILALVAK